MDRGRVFEKNLLALSERNQELASRLRKTEITHNRYKFQEARNGEVVPALLNPNGAAHPLHSMMDPWKEAKRLIDTVKNEEFLIFLGLGGGFYAGTALERDDISMTLVIEYDLGGMVELLCHRDYVRLFEDPRFSVFVDTPEEKLVENILNHYRPALSGGIKVIPLRPRTSLDPKPFTAARDAIEAAIGRVSVDYSVQAYFGRRWYSNIIRNLKATELIEDTLPQVCRVAVTAAGPSLWTQIPRLRENRKNLFLIATDTSLPCLLHERITPDAVISIDCQHISYYHFMNILPEGVLLFLDLASPPLLARLSKKPLFFSTGHPLTRYISRTWKAMPELDTSGGNVTYAALSLAELLGAEEIELYGADFSYPNGVSYARGTYIYSFFEKYQNRFSSLEAQASAFLFRTPLEKKNHSGSWYYETETLKFYREKLEEKSRTMEAAIIPIKSQGAPICIKQGGNRRYPKKNFSYSRTTMEAEKFLCFYKDNIAKLPKAGKNVAGYLASLKSDENTVFDTILPTAAAIKQRHPQVGFWELFEEVRTYCLGEINMILISCPYSSQMK